MLKKLMGMVKNKGHNFMDILGEQVKPHSR